MPSLLASWTFNGVTQKTNAVVNERAYTARLKTIFALYQVISFMGAVLIDDLGVVTLR